jgi:hypothetical protein
MCKLLRNEPESKCHTLIQSYLQRTIRQEWKQYTMEKLRGRVSSAEFDCRELAEMACAVRYQDQLSFEILIHTTRLVEIYTFAHVLMLCLSPKTKRDCE